MTLRELLPAADGDQNNQSEAPAAKVRKPRASRKKKEGEGAIAKTEGHQLVDDQRSNASELISGLSHQEQVYAATLGYQEGKQLAAIQIAGKTAGKLDALANQTLDNINALRETLQNNADNYNPVGFVADLGFNMGDDESQELRAKLAEFDREDLNAFLP